MPVRREPFPFRPSRLHLSTSSQPPLQPLLLLPSPRLHQQSLSLQIIPESRITPCTLVRAFSGTTPHCFSFFVLCGPFADACATRLIPRYTSPLRALYYCPLFSLFLFSPPANAILFFRLTSVSSTSALGFSFHCYFASPWLPTTPSTIRRLKSAVLRPILMPILTRNTPRAIMASPPNPSSRVSSTSWNSPRRVCLYHPKRTSPICSIPIKPTSISRSTKTPVPTVLPPPSTIRRCCWIPRFINSRDRLVSLSIRPI